jgi:hypothetical protein
MVDRARLHRGERRLARLRALLVCGSFSDKILLNRDSNFTRPYTPGDRLCEAIVFDFEMPSVSELASPLLLRTIFEQLNIAARCCAPPKADWAIEYRRRGNRSLSVGDVVVIGEQAWAVENYPRGWRHIGHADWTPVSLMGSRIS